MIVFTFAANADHDQTGQSDHDLYCWQIQSGLLKLLPFLNNKWYTILSKLKDGYFRNLQLHYVRCVGTSLHDCSFKLDFRCISRWQL